MPSVHVCHHNAQRLLQGRCKSCYAFAVTGALESMKALSSEENKLTSLSEQNIIDCSGD